jgi:predicted LPLAT superfamily acyltransferase
MKLIAVLTRLLGRTLITPVLYGVVLYFFVTGRVARNSIREYQDNLAQWSGRADLQASSMRVFRQFMSFSDSLLDKLDVWHGRIGLEHLDVDDPYGIRQLSHQHQGRGQMLVGAHLGNLEVCRALAQIGKKVQMNVLVHTRHAKSFNRLLNESGASHLRLIEVSNLDPVTMLKLSQRLEQGEWLAIAGDRVPLQEGRRSQASFLGKPAYFPQGPWLLAGILKCPVSLLFCLKHQGRYRISLEPFAESVQWQRKNREQVLTDTVQRYADRLAVRCLEVPSQWFNFYPFWITDEHSSQ